MLWIAGTSLTGVAFGFLGSLPPLPSDADTVAKWVEAGRWQLTWSGELMFFAVVLWGAGTTGLYAGRNRPLRLRHHIARVGVGVTLISLLIGLLALGRLVYPVIDVPISSDNLLLSISVAYGSQHLAMLGLAVTAFSFPISAHTAWGRRTANLCGTAAGAAFVAGSYPWATPALVNILIAGLVILWGAGTGATVLGAANRSTHARPQ